ncbi:hypothetical protein [Sphingomonas sp. KRR8]|nr:hypothetical protein [Sphingomonas sp. KRR8]
MFVKALRLQDASNYLVRDVPEWSRRGAERRGRWIGHHGSARS